MIDIQTRLRDLHRPDLLTRAARFAVDDYRRTRDLPRLLPGTPPLRPAPALVELLEVERGLNEDRKAGAVGYSLSRHVLALAAIMAEARDLAATRPPST
ncbi:hypothetical protein EU805_06735 [Salipiger sp. IMCC34102]|uniref:DUF6477 family protein n=1 Tax=Salipiger sp. IMCC34102 TaxID=2510647 RepID=UPI00101C3326|nr:DUF6477 family protein [Salipiger sp. IMCC34102]RYH03410.1 hypothetical protein EU805_06735 [Salipiger sp. IMCC34102]